MSRQGSTKLTLALGVIIVIWMPSTHADTSRRNDTGLHLSDTLNQMTTLYLEVFINDASTGLIGNFWQMSTGELITTAAELRDIGLNPLRSPMSSNEFIFLKSLPGVEFNLDEMHQRIYISSSDDARISKIIDLGTGSENNRLRSQPIPAGVLDYTVFAHSDVLNERKNGQFQGVSGAFDARLVSPYGAFNQSFIANFPVHSRESIEFIDTNWTYSVPDKLLTFNAGNITTRSLPWTRSSPLGGIQVRRNFTLHPEYITMPLPSFSGTVVEPSIFEIYTDNMLTYAEHLKGGPFSVINVPVQGGRSETRFVLRDAFGYETVTAFPFYTSSSFLQKGLVDFSSELGFPRRSLGKKSESNNSHPMGVVTTRYGITNRLTFEGHLEGGEGLFNGGGGVVAPLGNFGLGSVAVAGSHHGNQTGWLGHTSFEIQYNHWAIYGRLHRTMGKYHDIISASSYRCFDSACKASNSSDTRKLEQLTLNIPIRSLNSSGLALSYINMGNTNSRPSRIVSASYNQMIFGQASFFISALRNLNIRNDISLFTGFSIPLGNTVNTTISIAHNPNGMNIVADISRNEELKIGSAGWRLRTSEGPLASRTATASYRTQAARFQTDIEQIGNNIKLTGQVDGAIVVADGDIFTSGRVDGAFAIVNVGVSGVEVYHQHRQVGVSNSRGRLIVPGLNANTTNTISIDPKTLPVDADITSTKLVTTPTELSSVLLDFGITSKPGNALLRFIDNHGKALEAGLKGRLLNTSEEFFTGYDGETYIRSLSSHNRVEIEVSGHSQCYADFQFVPAPGRQVNIGDVPCL